MSILKILTLIALIAINAGCARTYQARWVDPSGHFDDYSMLQDGGSDDAILSYWNEDVDWSDYTKIIFEPIGIWTGEESQLKEIDHAERHRLKELLEVRMRESLIQDFKLVARPAPKTMRIELAITEAETSIPLLDFFSTLYPSARALSELKMLAIGTESYVGSAGYESMITDAETGELMMAAVDRRAGSKTLAGTSMVWDDVEQSYIHWAHQLRYQLCMKQGRDNCIEP